MRCVGACILNGWGVLGHCLPCWLTLNSSLSSSHCFVILFVADNFVLHTIIHVPLSVSASGEPDVIDIRNGSCLGSVL